MIKKVIHSFIFSLLLFAPVLSFATTYDMYHSQQAFPASLPLGVYSRYNSVIPDSNALRFHHFTRANVDITAVLHAIQINDIIKITDMSGNYYLWLVTGTPTHNAVYDYVPVSYMSLTGSDTTFNGYGANVDIDFDYTPPAPPVDENTLYLNPLITTANNSLADSLDITFSDAVDWLSVILLFIIGSWLGLLNPLLPWVIALVVISAIVYFLYRTFRYFNH
jgi:hypothetical protein